MCTRRLARHGLVDGVRVAILCHSINSVILEPPEITEISKFGPNPAEVKVPR